MADRNESGNDEESKLFRKLYEGLSDQARCELEKVMPIMRDEEKIDYNEQVVKGDPKRAIGNMSLVVDPVTAHEEFESGVAKGLIDKDSCFARS